MSTSSSMPADVRGSDLALAVVLTVAVFGGSMFALRHARLEHNADFPIIDPGGGIAIAVRPVADLPSGKSTKGSRKAGREDKQASAVPLAWRRKVPRASAPTKPEPEPTDTQALTPPPTDEPPPEPVPPELPSIEPDNPAAPDPAAEPDPAEDPQDASAQDSSADVETPELPQVDEGGEGQQEAGGEGQPEAGGEGGSEGTDPLLERAIAFYRARLVAWFSARFRVTGSGLSPAQLAKYRVRAHIDVGEDLRIVDYQILSSDHPDFEQAARTTLEAMRGMKLPPPPENYPGAVQHQLTVTFTCAQDSCD